MTDVFTQQNYSNSQLEDLKAADAAIDNSGDFPVVQQQQKAAEPTATSTTTISSVTTKMTSSNVDADIKAQIKKLGKDLKTTLRQQFSALSNKHQARLHEDASAHVADNEPLIRPATTLTSMKTLGGCVFIDVDITTFEATAKKSFENDAVRGDFAQVYQRVTFVPNRDSGDKFDAVLAYRSKGGSVHEEQRDAIVEWHTAFAHELFGEDATTPKTLAMYRSFRGVAKPRSPSSGSKKRKSLPTDTVVVDGEDENAANDATSESENAAASNGVVATTSSTTKNADDDSMSSDNAADQDVDNDDDVDDKAAADGNDNDDDEESASLEPVVVQKKSSATKKAASNKRAKKA